MGKSSKQTTTRTPYDAAAVKSANDGLASANTRARATLDQFMPGLNQRIQQAISAPAPQYATDARAQLDKTINGEYLDPASNPYAKGMADLIAKRTQGGYNATFGASGRAHGGLAALLSGQGVADALGSFYGGIYENERGRQQQATMAAPAFHADEFADIEHLLPAVSGSAGLPLNIANAYGQGVTAVNAPYTTETTVQKTPFSLGSAVGLAGMIGGALFPPAAAAMPALGGLSGLSGLIGTPRANIGGGISMGRFLG